ncbi:Peripherin-2 [Dufourea novaeangliae]|uniref:Peripherin-2 n=2 Tax=Dufourea novaeangliae TaxID=178035 RepID=A0A154P5B1_DUFNO|nr:Peripherin-2 [Dufourea novaeangliae]
MKSCLYLKLETSRVELDDQQKVDDSVDPRDANRLLFLHVIICLLSGFLVAVLNATYLALLSGFQQKSRDGLTEAIQKYGSDVTVKSRMDAVQAEFECCGNNGYDDWFRVPWLRLSIDEGGTEDAEKGPRLEEQSVPEEQDAEQSTFADVPFSCCSNDIPKPCVHHDILSPSAAYDYDPKRLTIATIGCRSKIVDRAETIRIFLSGYLVLLSVYQVVLAFLARLLQTAHGNELYIGPRKTLYHVWILFGPENATADPIPKRKRNEEVGPRKRSKATIRRRLPSSSFSSSSSTVESSDGLEEIGVARKRDKGKRNTGNMLNKIRSKLSSVKSKSLPYVLKSSTSKRLRVRQRDVTRSEDKAVGFVDRVDTVDEETNAYRKLLSHHITKSEVVQRDQYRDTEQTSSPEDSSMILDLPAPPSPPLFLVKFAVEKEDTGVPVTKVTNTDKTFVERIIGNLNSGRRRKVLEKFGTIEKKSNETRHRECGGADNSGSSSDHASGSIRYKKPIPTRSNADDVYDRFRGSLQHTLARREAAAQARRGSKRIYAKVPDTTRRNSLLARLGCKNVPPSYRLLANVEDQKRPTSTVHTLPPAPPPLPPPPIPSNPAPVCRQQQCSICHRPVQQSPASSRGSPVEDVRLFTTAPPRTTQRPQRTVSRGRGSVRQGITCPRIDPPPFRDRSNIHGGAAVCDRFPWKRPCS